MTPAEREEPFTEDARAQLSWAIKSLAECFGYEKRGWEVIQKAKAAHDYISEFLGRANPFPDLTEEEVEVCRDLHTFLRKYDDSDLSVILYRMIQEDRAKAVWYAFCKEINRGIKEKDKFIIERSLEAARLISDSMPTDYIIFDSVLRLWAKGGLPQAIKWLKEIGKDENSESKVI